MHSCCHSMLRDSSSCGLLGNSGSSPGFPASHAHPAAGFAPCLFTGNHSCKYFRVTCGSSDLGLPPSWLLEQQVLTTEPVCCKTSPPAPSLLLAPQAFLGHPSSLMQKAPPSSSSSSGREGKQMCRLTWTPQHCDCSPVSTPREGARLCLVPASSFPASLATRVATWPRSGHWSLPEQQAQTKAHDEPCSCPCPSQLE